MLQRCRLLISLPTYRYQYHFLLRQQQQSFIMTDVNARESKTETPSSSLEGGQTNIHLGKGHEHFKVKEVSN